MNEVVLEGLGAEHFPLAALAAFGLLRVVTEDGLYKDAMLRWERDAVWRPVLSAALSRDELVDGLALLACHGRQTRERPELFGDLELGEAFHAAARRAAYEATAEDRVMGDFAASYAAENRKGLLGKSPWHMVTARLPFLKSIRTNAEELDPQVNGMKRVQEMLRAALFGPWEYERKKGAPSMGFDPGARQVGALEGIPPNEQGSKRVPAATWLALEALPLFPCVLARDGRIRCAGWSDPHPGMKSVLTLFSWPVWTRPLSLQVVRSLLGNPALVRDAQWNELSPLGVAAVFRCVKDVSERYHHLMEAQEVWTAP